MHLSFPNFYSTWRTWPILGQCTAYGIPYLGSSFQISAQAIKLSKPLRVLFRFLWLGHPFVAVIFILNFLQKVWFQKWVRTRSWDILSSCKNYKNRRKQDGWLHQEQVLCWMIKPHNFQDIGGCHNKRQGVKIKKCYPKNKYEDRKASRKTFNSNHNQQQKSIRWYFSLLIKLMFLRKYRHPSSKKFHSVYEILWKYIFYLCL